MNLYYDLHIHSALSPCSDESMTPNNIINMSILKELDIISVTDHNSAENIEAVLKCAKNKDILVIPGMEIETMEEIHVLCMFKDLESVLKLQSLVYELLPPIKNREEIFGRQSVLNEYDEETGVVDKILLNATGISVNDLYTFVNGLDGVLAPAHVDRSSYSILSNLGAIPQNLDFKYIEISKQCDIGGLKDRYPEIENYNLLRSSDAHYLGNILERESFLDLEERSADCLIAHLKNK